ncbi:MAG: purine/pyrimidine permease [Rubrobacteraceae bacterium]|uniref:solute carrier family 23 protein n=1 Tax=Rubrobacter naiadicus TaxID=1392641 RepID=UPI0023627BBB|nr:solute carrier family 23 protein [Rubrobacter naiadicus]MBX6764277.1 purine/pyrimidine permease [Rubrobacteraceae bacterium]MCL6437592.1 purine/pyrimidine permease [Rubrobacteraceae bacterium]
MSETTAGRTRVRHPVDEVLPAGKLAVYGFQHVLAFYAGAVIVPILLAGAIGLSKEHLVYLISADLFTCGIASIIQSVGFWEVGVRLPLLQGVTFTAVAPMIAIGKANGGGVKGLLVIYGSIIVAGIFTFLLAPYFSRIIRFFPPVVTGTVITVIGVTLVPVAIQDAGGGDPSAPSFGSLQNITLALFVLVLILVLYRVFRDRFLSTIAVLIGLAVGTAVSAALGVADFGQVSKSAWLGVTTPFHYGLPHFQIAAIISMVIVMLITMIETTGDTFATGEIVGKRLGPRDIARALRADGLSTLIGGILNSFPYTCFAENIGLVRLTAVKSRWVVASAGGIMILLGLFPKLAAIVASIPTPVIGGAALALFGTVAAIGIQTLQRVDFSRTSNVLIVAVSIGFALTPVVFPQFFQHFPSSFQVVLGSGITLGSICAFVLNFVFNVIGGGEGREAAGSRQGRLTLEEVNRMSREEFVGRFGRLFEGGRWVAEEAYDRRPFASVYELRTAFQDVLLEADPERQLALIRSYPPLGVIDLSDEALAEELGLTPSEYEVLTSAASGGVLGPESLRDRAAAGLDTLSPEEYDEFLRLNRAYREKFGFPLVIALRERESKQEVLEAGRARLANSPAQERMAAMVEIAKIAGYRLEDIVEESGGVTVGSES